MLKQPAVFAGDVAVGGEAQTQRRVQQTLGLGQVVAVHQLIRGEVRQRGQQMVFRQVGVQRLAQGFRFESIARRHGFEHLPRLSFAINAAFGRQGEDFAPQRFRLQFAGGQGEFGGVQGQMGEAAHDAVIRRVAFQRAQGRLQFAATAVLMFADQRQHPFGPDMLLAPQKARIDLGAALVGEQQFGRQHRR